MLRKADKGGGPPVNPWDREAGLNEVRARSRGAGAGEAAQAAAPDPAAAWTGPAAEIDARTITPHYGSVPCIRKEPPRAVLLSAWAGILGAACGVFCTCGPWLFQQTDLSIAVWATGILGILLGIYASVGAHFGVGRPDVAAAGVILGAAGLLVTFVWTPGVLSLTPT
jgi:hypothetical protein